MSSTPTRNPWKFTLNVTAGLQYSQNRGLLEDIDRLDRSTTETVSFAGVPGHSFIFAYQGVMNAIAISNLRITSFVGNSLILNTLPALPTGSVLFRKGDLIQIVGYPHPFTVTADVLRGTGETVTLTTHRPNFITASVANLAIVVGNACQFKVFCPNMPTYTLVPGGTDAIIEWTSEFGLYEFTGDVA